MNTSQLFNFSTFLIGFAANSIILIVAPSNLTENYLIYYTISNAVSSIILLLLFTSVRGLKYGIGIFLIAAFSFVVNKITFEDNTTLFVLYPIVLLGVDYLVTQTLSINMVNAYRYMLIISLVPFMTNTVNFVNALEIRVLAIIMCGFYIVLSKKDVTPLKIRYPAVFLASCYLFYTAPLLVLQFITTNSNELKWWYITTQIGLALILKLRDFSMRSVYITHRNLNYAVYVVSFILPIPCFILYPKVAIFSLYYVGFFGLIYSARFLVQDELLKIEK
jgi:hypothetical protein